MYLINVSGQAQNGKDTLADYLAGLLTKKEICLTRAAWAKGVKRVFSNAFGVDAAFIEKWKTNPEPPPGFNMNVRKSLQFIGDGFRQIMETIWIDMALRDGESLIISDGRYINEFKRVHQEVGINILVARPDMLNDDPNQSEAQIRPYADWALASCPAPVTFMPYTRHTDYPDYMPMFDIFIRNDSSLDEFYSNIEKYILPFIMKDYLNRQ